MRRGDAPPFTARVLSATEKGLMVDLGFGATPVPMESISPEGFVKIADETFLGDAEPEVVGSRGFLRLVRW